ncbi:small hydrophilic protein [Streptomyces sp. ISL-99]|uniref:small hydrophilic protein n=1 Tax=Streptomyces sp. ISL-99 TaxID=2819193 RepID=UPI001BEC3284|nr:small hydrophilic protein [Streptomyces sp. ISL-99]MBT2525729.1 small hydrophilic protein [Streptomyces sp. ISL-99]
MAFSHRLATLAAVVAIPLGIAATSYALTDSAEAPKVPHKVELESTPPGTGQPSRRTTPGSTPGTTPSDTVVPGPTATDDDSDSDADDEGDRDPDRGQDDEPGEKD